MVPAYITKKNDSAYYTGKGEFLFYIPEKYFDMSFAIANGEYINTIGVMLYSVKESENADPTKKLKPFKLPTMFTTKPGRIEKVRKLKLLNLDEDDYRVLHYTNNGEDQIITSLSVPQDIENVETFYRMFVKTGNIPNYIPYNEIQDYFYESMALNGGNYNTNWQLFGMLISELCRDKNDYSIPYYMSAAYKRGDMLSYKSIAIRDVPKYVSPFSSITSENWNEAIIHSINMEEKDINSPLEKIMMG